MTNLELFTKIFGTDRAMSVAWWAEEADKEKLGKAYAELIYTQVEENKAKKENTNDNKRKA